MPGFGDVAETAVLELVFRGTAYVLGPATMLSLHTADPGDTGASEVVGGTYARQPVTWAPAVGNTISPAAPVDFPGMPAVTVTNLGVWTPGGTFICGCTTTPRLMNAGDSYRANTGTVFTLE